MSSRLRDAVLLITIPLSSFASCSYDFVLREEAAGDSGVVGAKTQLAAAGASCLDYGDCQSGDCASGICVDRVHWICNWYASCVWDGGSCRADAASCSSYLDCCSRDCGWGACLEANPAAVLPADAGYSAACRPAGPCTLFSDCCSQNCYEGRCAAAPPDEVCEFGAPCLAFSDCCSFECRAGTCVDSTAPNTGN